MRGKRVLGAAILAAAVLIAVVWVVVAGYDYNKLKPEIESAFREATGRELVLKGDIGFKIGLAPSLVVGDAVLQNASWGSRPEMVVVRRMEVRLSLIPLIFRHIQVKKIVLVGPDILIETKDTGETNLEFLGKAGPGNGKREVRPGARTKLTVNEVSIRDGLVTYRSGESGKTYVVVVERFDASARSAENPLKVALKGSYNGKPFEAAGKLTPLAALTDAGRPWPFDLALEAAGATVRLNGTVGDVTNLRDFDAKVTAKSGDAAQIGKFLGSPVPYAEGPLEVSCRITDPGPKTYLVDGLRVAAAGSDLEGSLRVDLSGPRPVFSAELRSTRLDLNPFFRKDKAAPSPGGPSSSGRARLFPSRPLPLDFLAPADASLRLTAKEARSPHLALHDLDVSLTLKGGLLSVKPLRAVIGGGSIDGGFTVHAAGKASRMEAAATIEGVDLGAVLKELKKTEVLDGRMDARIDVAGRGDSIAALMSGLTGTVYAIMGEGRINNRYIGLLASDMSSNVFRLINPFHGDAPVTAVRCIVCGFKIRKGIARTTALVVNSDSMSVVGKGTVNLRTEGLNLSLKPVPKEGMGAGITGGLGLSAAELAKPFKLTGTLMRPSLGIDLTQAAIEAAKAVGGFMLLGPAGLGAVMVGESSSEKNLCPLAAGAARQGVELKLTGKKGKKRGMAGKATEGVQKGVGGIEKGLKKLFGK